MKVVILTVKFHCIFNDKNVKINGITSNLTLKDLIFLAARGGWPETLNIPDNKERQ